MIRIIEPNQVLNDDDDDDDDDDKTRELFD